MASPGLRDPGFREYWSLADPAHLQEHILVVLSKEGGIASSPDERTCQQFPGIMSCPRIDPTWTLGARIAARSGGSPRMEFDDTGSFQHGAPKRISLWHAWAASAHQFRKCPQIRTQPKPRNFEQRESRWCSAWPVLSPLPRTTLRLGAKCGSLFGPTGRLTDRPTDRPIN